ncbi:MAG: hypothetical protein ABL920_10200 [Methylotenera sp.]
MDNTLALCTCPECLFKDAEVKKAKNGTAYRFCPDCTAQYFTNKKPKSDRLYASVGLDSNGEKIADKATKKPETVTVKPQTTAEKPKASGFNLDNL